MLRGLVLPSALLLCAIHFCAIEALAPARPIRRVACIGAGIAGLSTANALLRQNTGVEYVDVFERRSKLEPSGGGVQLNGGAAVLHTLGLGAELKEAGQPVERILTRSVSGRVLLDIDVVAASSSKIYSKYLLDEEGDPFYFLIMRDKLQDILLKALPKTGRVQLDKSVQYVEEVQGRGAVVVFSDGSRSTEYDLIVGADGVRGGACKTVESDQPINSGLRIQFCVAKAGAGLRPKGTDAEMHQWFGGDTYALTASYGGFGEGNYDMAAIVYSATGRKVPENAEWETADFRDACLARLKSKGFPAEVLRVVESGERFFDLGVYYRNPLQPWSSPSGQLVLLGDSAHAMPPTLGQGANQAVQDAQCLALCIAAHNQGEISQSEALAKYETTRKSTVATLLAKSVILGVVETLPEPLGPAFRDNFFYTLGKLGIAQKVLIDAAIPKVV